MSRKRRVFGASFKAKVALAACRGDKTTAQLASQFSVHTSQVTCWKKQLLEQAAELFEDGRRKAREDERQRAGVVRADRPAEDGGRVVEKKICPARLKASGCIEAEHAELSIARQCEVVGLPRSSWYYTPVGETAENLALMRQIDEQYLETPFYGSRKLAKVLGVNRKRVQRLMRMMGLEAIYPKRRTTRPGAGHKIYPYLLRNLEVTRPDQVWATDITYMPLRHGFLYLVAVMDWYSRYVLAWRLSNTLEGSFCLEALDEALGRHGRRSSTVTRDRSSRRRRSPGVWRRPAWRSAWMAVAGRWTTCSSNGCGGA